MQASPPFRYRLLRRVAVDADRVVFLGEQLGVANFSRRVAVKVFQAEFAAVEQLLDLIRSQVHLNCALHHGSIVGLSDSGIHKGSPYLVFDYVDGPDLEAILKRRGEAKVPVEATLRIAAQLADALHYTHTSGADGGRNPEPVHGGLSPSRVLVEVSGAVRVTGFGSPLKDLAYSSPEQLRGDPLDGRSDLFSLGGLLYECLTGVQPFRQSTPHRTVDAILGHPCESPCAHRHDLSPSLGQLVLSCLEKSPESRPHNLDELRKQLLSHLDFEASWTHRRALSDFLAETFPERTPGPLKHSQPTPTPPSWDHLVHRLSARVVPLPQSLDDKTFSSIGLVNNPYAAGPRISQRPEPDEAGDPLAVTGGAGDA